MCGRYAASFSPDDLVDDFEIDLDATDEPARSILKNPQEPPAGTPDWNMAPTKQAPVVLTRAPREDRDGDPVRQLRLLTWGLVPSWAKDVKVGLRMINARAETLLTKGAFVKAAHTRRAIVPAEGWYEWQASPTVTDAKGKPRKQPFFVKRQDGRPCAFAGVYEFWRDRSLADDDPDAWLTTYAIVTTAAEPGLDRIHDRQPLVLDPDRWAHWLDPEVTDTDEIAGMLEGMPPGRFEAYPVTTAVSSGRNNGARLLDPAPESDLRGVVDPATGELIGG
ncbi:SOS response-associated peptidase [Calidifontibacter sp. DB0510]|uniref:Abasic site processing protein n=1 Tax=Metallococcus carri TaxID=1656884 RepID=A0A967B2N9_9MICO|nr:SOS response-associated peptidase [Metallococcus carri]NHN56428.1 SOS response-associated peptidase [Metallococcus carri]NOP36052.1 SOS response-associated peptidase [Calidifontibacter sp. DB2511S]